MPLPFACLVGFAIGAALALAARAEIARAEGPLATSRPMAVALALAGLVYAPLVGYFAAFHEDWAFLYLARGERVPSAIGLALVLGAAALVVAGLASGAWAITSRRPQLATAFATGPLGVAGVAALVFARRLSVSASYAQYHGHFGVTPIGSSALGRGVLLALLVLVASVAWAVRAVRT